MGISRSCEIALHGSYFSDNFGDMMLVGLFVQWVREVSDLIHVSLPFAPESIRSYLGADGTKGLRSLGASRCLLYVGGGYFGEGRDNPQRWAYSTLVRHISVGTIVRLLRKPYAIIGVGAGPISNRGVRRMITSLCNNAWALSVRDTVSRDYLVEYGVEPAKVLVNPDPLILLRSGDIPAEVKRQVERALQRFPRPVRLGVHLSHSSQQGEEWAILVHEIANFARDNPDVELILLQDHSRARGQVEAAREIAAKLPHQAVMVPYRDPWLLVGVLEALDLVVTTKLHVGVVATALGTPVLAFPYHPKTPRFYEQIGMADRCHPVWLLKQGDVRRRLDLYISGRERVNVPRELSRQALRNRTLVHDFVSSVLDG